MNTKLLLIGFSSLLLIGCGGGGKNSNNVGAISNNAADSDSVELDKPQSLSSNLNSIFGAADGEPIPVEDNDSVQDVIDRGRS